MKAQNVGIGTLSPDPSAQLHISSSDKGLLIPKIGISSLNTPSPVNSPAEGLLIFNDGTGGVLPKGFYWWDGSGWRNLLDSVSTFGVMIGDGTPSNPIGLQGGTNSGDILIWDGSQWVIKPSPFDSVCGTALANYIQKWTGTEFCNSIIYDNGTQISIGTTTPHSSAVVEVFDTTRGVLFPRLTTVQRDNIPNPAIGLLIFNLDFKCFELYDGNQWVPVGDCRQYPKSCKEWRDNYGATTDGIYWIDPDGSGPLTAYQVYCNMTTNGGGWTLIASIADDGNDYWTWNNAWVHWVGNEHGSLDSFRIRDFQSWAWRDVRGDQVLFMRADDTTKYLIYDDILNNEPMVAKYQAIGQSLITNNVGGKQPLCDRITPSIEYGPPTVVSGTWYEECGPGLYLKLQNIDTDGGSIDNAIGFIWRSVDNNGCPYDDSYGGIHICSVNPSTENNWTAPEFYQQNFGGSALLIFVR